MSGRINQQTANGNARALARRYQIGWWALPASSIWYTTSPAAWSIEPPPPRSPAPST